MKYVTVCLLVSVLFVFTGCAQLQELQGRIAQAEVELTRNENVIKELENKSAIVQARVDEKQTRLESAILAGDVKATQDINEALRKERNEQAVITEALKKALRDNNEVKNIVSAVKQQTKNANTPMDYLLGILAVAGSIFGVHGIGQRQRRKIAERNQLNPNTS